MRNTAVTLGGAGVVLYEFGLAADPRPLLAFVGIVMMMFPMNVHVMRLMDAAVAPAGPVTVDEPANTDPLADVCCDMGRIAWPAPCPWHAGDRAQTGNHGAVMASDPPSMVIVAAGRRLTVPAVGPVRRSDAVIVRDGTPSLFLNVPPDLDSRQRMIPCDDLLARLDLPANTVGIQQSMIVALGAERAGQSG